MTYGQGDIVVGADPFGHSPNRPYLVVLNETHPFHGEELLAVAITTTERPEAIPLAGAYERGGLPKESYVSPWALLTLKHSSVSKRVAVASRSLQSRVYEATTSYLSPDDD